MEPTIAPHFKEIYVQACWFGYQVQSPNFAMHQQQQKMFELGQKTLWKTIKSKKSLSGSITFGFGMESEKFCLKNIEMTFLVT